MHSQAGAWERETWVMTRSKDRALDRLQGERSLAFETPKLHLWGSPDS